MCIIQHTFKKPSFKQSFRAGLCAGLLLALMAEGSCAAQTSGNASLGDGLFARISTNKGDMVLRLEYQKAPLTVCNFVALAEGKMTAAGGKPFYNGLVFHRIIANFMIQGGDPNGNGTGGPGYRFPDEFDPSLRHSGPGTLSMANSGPGTNGSQFFITLAATPWLDDHHTVFGRVVQGTDVLQTIGKVRTDSNDRPAEPVTITRVTIIRNGTAANAFKADQAAFDTLVQEKNAAAAEKLQAQREAARARREADLAIVTSKYPNARETPSGLRYIITKEGTGAKPEPGKTVAVNYKGMLLSGNVFDNSDVHGGPLELTAGRGQVIQGWEETILDMKTGEKRTVIIPPELAYGDQDVGNGLIPANSFLIFEMEMVRIR